MPAAQAQGPQQQSSSGKWASFFVRFRWTVILIATFCFFIYMGHVPLMAMILGIQVPSIPASVVEHAACAWLCFERRQQLCLRAANVSLVTTSCSRSSLPASSEQSCGL